MYAGLAFVLFWLARQSQQLAMSAMQPVATATPTAVPGANLPTEDNPFACSTRTLQQFDLGTLAPLQPTPDGSEWRGCWPGYVGTGRDSGGATGCKSAYTGKTAAPQKFRRTGNKWYGCTFNSSREVWSCPSCSV